MRLMWASLSLWLVAASSVASASAEATVERRFAFPDGLGLSPDPATWCHRIHLLPEGSVLRARVLQSCPDFGQKIPKKYDTPAGQDKKDFGAIFDQKKADNVKAEQERVRTQQQQAVLDKSDAVQAQVKKAKDTAAANAAARKAEADAAAKEAAQDLLEQQQQIRQQLDDHLKTLINKRDQQAATNAARDDVLDTATVADAKKKWTEYEASLADAKAKAATDVSIVEAAEAKIKAAGEQRKRDLDQQKADADEAKADQALADSAEKQARAAARENRAKELQTRAETREREIAAARQERDAALDRQKLVNMEDVEKAQMKAKVDDAEAALAANRKNRQDEELDRQKRMDEYTKEEADIKARREAFEKAEADREARLKKRKEDEEARLRAKADEDARLAKAAEDDVPPEERSKQDHEEDCTDKTVTCGSGKCFQVKGDPTTKRCQCEKDVKGKNCELAACDYDVTDGTGKSTKQKGNMVNGQCVRWKATYRCACDKPWRLDLKCVKKEGLGEVQVANTECRGLREPENEYADDICELCSQCSLPTRRLEANGTEADDMRRRLMGTSCLQVHACGREERVAFVERRFYKPLQLATKGNLQTSVKAATKEECKKKCLERTGVVGSASESRRRLHASKHCTWFWFDANVKAAQRCSIFASGEFPELVPLDANNQPIYDRKRKAGFVGFVTYPRRWEMFRKASRNMKSQKFCVARDEAYEVFFPTAPATLEGEGTFTRGPNRIDSDCISETDTVLENALGYLERLPKQISGKPVPEVMKKDAVVLPGEWDKFGDTNRPPATVVSKGSGLQWKYSVDRHFRVKTVEGTSWKLHEGERGEVAFEKAFNWVNDRMYFSDQKAPFCAGHLVAYQQKPPNFYFNYVPQHENSNSNGCWYLAEEAAKNIIQLGCKINYRIELDYGLHGLVEPDVVKYQMPDWATENPIIYKPTKPPTANGKTSAPRPPPSYDNEDLKCHYRYRPYIMYLDFSILEPIDSSAHCKNLHEAMSARPGTQLLHVSEDTVITSRIFAYLLQKSSTKGEETVPAKDAYSLKRMLGVATAMKKRSLVTNGLSCYAETGNLAPFKVQLGLEFYYAFLGDTDHVKCLTILEDGDWTSTCQRWSMLPDADPTSSHGVLVAPDGECISNDANGGLEMGDRNDAMVSCGVFKYDLPGREFTAADLALPKKDPRSHRTEDFIVGSLYFDNFSKCLALNGRLVATSPKACWKLRISYYNFPRQTRELREHATEARAGDDDDDDDAGAGECRAFDFTDLDDEEPTYE